MTWLLTSAGKTISLAHVGATPISVQEVAYALSHINRFTGHALRPISVAEHSLMVSEIVEREFGVRSAAVLLAALMHDAHEAITGDLSSPMKQLIGPAWYEAENRIQHEVLQGFGLLTAFNTSHSVIKRADLMALSAERQQLMPGDDVWPCQITHPAPDWVRYSSSDFTPDDWRMAFLGRYEELNFALHEQHERLKTAGVFTPA
jgi:hypothetical protein